MLNFLYAHIAQARRRRSGRMGYQRRLRCPVISIGNLRVGGSGKTPTVACVARLLAGMGEHPAVLSRGYARQHALDGVVVVSDGVRLRADLGASGDEPLMLARSIPGAAVLVSRDRFLAGRLAEHHFGATVHVLDDGFQHLSLARDIDIVVVSSDDIADPRTRPGGRLREPLSAASAAGALLVTDATDDQARAIGERLQVPHVFTLARIVQPPRRHDAFAPDAPAKPGRRALAIAGIARPERFFLELVRDGWDLAGTLPFPDHHRYTARDVAAIARQALAAQATSLVTTEKDLMRLLPFRPLRVPLLWVRWSVTTTPDVGFRSWLQQRLADARLPRGAVPC